jgi:hypothetical protein
MKFGFRTFSLIIGFMTMAVPSFAQKGVDSQDVLKKCPIEIIFVGPQATVYGRVGKYLEIQYRNISGKTIKAVKFGALFFNALDEPTDSYTRYIDSQGIKWDDEKSDARFPQPEVSGYWSQYFDTVDKADAYVIKVKFADGTFWQDDGSYRCNAGIPELHISKGGGLKAHEAAIKELERKTRKANTD